MRAAQDLFKANGHTITYDWTYDYEAQEQSADEAGRLCKNGVLTCQIFYLCIPNVPSIGAWVELGLTKAARSCVIVAGSGQGRLDIWKLMLHMLCKDDTRGVQRVLHQVSPLRSY